MKTFRLVSVSLIISFILTACGSQSAPTPEPLTPITLQLQWVTQAQFAGYFVGLGDGFFFSAVFGGFFYAWKRNFESGVLVNQRANFTHFQQCPVGNCWK